MIASSVHLIPSAIPTPPIKRGNSNFAVRLEHTMASASKPTSVHDFTVKDARGNDDDLSIYKGMVLLTVNVASQFGLIRSIKIKGQKYWHSPAISSVDRSRTNEQIVEFACTRFKAEYHIFDKVDVNGNNVAPIYKYLKSSKGGFLGDGIKWNFAKFLLDKEGKVVDRYAPTTSPLSIEITIRFIAEHISSCQCFPPALRKDVKKLLSVA